MVSWQFSPLVPTATYYVVVGPTEEKEVGSS